MRIDIWSDVICPWCYLGARRLELARSELPWGAELEIRWRAYQLDPRAPLEPQDLRAVLERKYGPGSYDAMTRRLTRLGAEVGLDYRFDRTQRVNTFDAHRLLAWAETKGSEVQDRLAWRLFEGYFTRGENVAERESLTAVAGEAGLSIDETAAVLASDRYGDAVRADIDAALDRGITGVPAFVIEDAWLIPGAQEVDTMVTVLERARARLVPAAPESGDACAVDDPAC